MKNDGLKVAWNDLDTNYIKPFGAEFITGDKNNISAFSFLNIELMKRNRKNRVQFSLNGKRNVCW